ncbi:MAG: glycosyltransferase family 4 protein [Pseudomonadota bacterium]
MSNRIAFYAPIKPPDHPIPSGDRLIARNLIKALTLAEYSVELATPYIAYSKRSDPAILAERKRGALDEAKAILERYQSAEKRDQPDLWLTYHPYCKAPDWIGPIVTEALEIPYVTVEAARTRQGENDEWGPWRTEAQMGIKQADLHLVFKPSDKAYLSELLGGADRLMPLAPFFDDTSLEQPIPFKSPRHFDPATPMLVCVGMMRKGKKDQNFYLLADLLSSLLDVPWNLVLVGSGPEEENIRTAFKTIPSHRQHWAGECSHAEVLGTMRAGDVFVWPGWREPIGMVYLEAASQGLPSVAFGDLGVPLVVEDGGTGLLARSGDAEDYRNKLRALLENPERRKFMGQAATEKVTAQHSIAAAARRLKTVLSPFLNNQN